MALKDCDECGKPVSTDAKACPHCGANPPTKTKLSTWAIGLFSAAIIGSCINSQDGARERASKIPPPTPEQVAATKKADDEINAGIRAGRQIKASLKNPKSFELESFLIFPGGATCFEYRATNSFNAVVPGKAVFDPSDNTILSMDNGSNRFIKKWNEICTKTGGNERARGLNALSAF